MSPSNMPPPHHVIPSQPTSSASGPPPALGKRRKTPSELRQEQLSRAVQSRSCQREAFGALEAPRSASDPKANEAHLVDTEVGLTAASGDDASRAALTENSGGSSISRRKFLGDRIYDSDKPGILRDDSGRFRDVTQISSRTKAQTPAVAIDMKDALKVLAPAAKRGFSSTTRGRAASAEDAHPSFEISETAPVDLSLKVSVRFISVDSLFWCHRLTPTAEADGLKHFVQSFRSTNEEPASKPTASKERIQDRFGKEFYQALHSWVHPSPDHIELYDLATAGARDESKKLETVGRLYRKWEDAFRSLYYMFCRKHCNLFYICTRSFAVMFERGNSCDGNEDKSQAYWSRSTRGLRKALQEHGVEFSMPLCNAEGDASSLEDMRDLSELEKMNPGRTRLVDPKAAVDNNLESLLAFKAGSVHRLFDFLLNYRYLITYTSGADFPTLYSPVQFSKAYLFSPEIKCRRTQHSAENSTKQAASTNSNSVKEAKTPFSDMLYTLELNGPPGAYITPWVVNGICAVFQKSQKPGFEVSIVTDPLSRAFNIAKERSSATSETRQEGNDDFVTKPPSSAVSLAKIVVVKHLRYSDGYYQATMAPVL